MRGQEKNLEKKKRGRPAIGRGDQVNTMLRPEIVAAIDAASQREADNPSRPEMVRRIIRDWLVAHGYLPHRES